MNAFYTDTEGVGTATQVSTAQDVSHRQPLPVRAGKPPQYAPGSLAHSAVQVQTHTVKPPSGNPLETLPPTCAGMSLRNRGSITLTTKVLTQAPSAGSSQRRTTRPSLGMACGGLPTYRPGTGWGSGGGRAAGELLANQSAWPTHPTKATMNGRDLQWTQDTWVSETREPEDKHLLRCWAGSRAMLGGGPHSGRRCGSAN